MTAVSAEPSRVLAIDGAGLLGLLNTDLRIGYEVTSSLLRVARSRLVNIEGLLATGKSSPVFVQSANGHGAELLLGAMPSALRSPGTP